MTAHPTTALIAGLSLLVIPARAGAQGPPPPEPPSIVAQGEAVVRRAPDRVFITASVETRAPNPRDAQRQNAERMAEVQKRVLAAGIARDAVRTLGYTIQQNVDFVDGRRVPRDFMARNALEVRLDAVDRAGEIIDTLVSGGATSIGNVQFDLRDRSEAEREAIRLAVEDARGRAEAAAAGMGRGIGRVIKIEDVRQPSGGPRPMMSVARDAAAESVTSIEPGQIEIRAQVVLTVAIQ
jgi:hypothetical protein